MSHVTVYAVSYLPRLLSTNNLDENIVVSMAVALILLALLTVLGITSLNVVKRIMTATTWNRAQRLSYVFFGLVFCHLAFILAPAALHGGIAAQRSLLVYTALFGAYTILRIAKAIGNGHARRQPRVTQVHQPDCRCSIQTKKPPPSIYSLGSKGPYRFSRCAAFRRRTRICGAVAAAASRSLP